MIKRPLFITEIDWKLLKNRYSEEELPLVIEQIKNDYPVQYLIGNVEFYHNIILVNENVLVPRFETELLVDKLTKYIKQYNLTNSNIIDICTGSGCISIALKSVFSNANITGIDISYSALEVANNNKVYNKVDVTFEQQDIFREVDVTKKYDILVSNPPYVKLDEVVSPNTKYEPSIALYPKGDDDIIFYKRILDISSNILNKKSIIAFEIGSTQDQRICDYAKKIYPNAVISVEKDFNDYNRFIFIFNNCE